jgi:D-amino-acid dehydrogenase
MPLLLGEAHVIVTPMAGQLRMTTGLDLVGFDPNTDQRRIDSIRAAAGRYLPDWQLGEDAEPWHGYRPLSPDSRPIIGPLRRYPNLLLATGHGQLGMTLAPITGKLIGEIVAGEQTTVDLNPFLPKRFGL